MLPHNRKKVHEQVVEVLREQILGGRLTEGDRLPPERDLVDRFGVSRAAVRDGDVDAKPGATVFSADGVAP